MNTLPDNRHFWKSPWWLRRNWNTTSPAPLGNHKPPSRLVRSLSLREEEAGSPATSSPKHHRSLSHISGYHLFYSPAAPSGRCRLRSVSTSPKPLEPEVSLGLGRTSANGFLVSFTPSLLPPFPPPTPPRAALRDAPSVPGERRPQALGMSDFTDKQSPHPISGRAKSTEGFDGNL